MSSRKAFGIVGAIASLGLSTGMADMFDLSRYKKPRKKMHPCPRCGKLTNGMKTGSEECYACHQEIQIKPGVKIVEEHITILPDGCGRPIGNISGLDRIEIRD